jgi:hypothetical protein
MDEKDKFSAKNLDEHARQISNGTRGIAYHNGVHRQDNT